MPVFDPGDEDGIKWWRTARLRPIYADFTIRPPLAGLAWGAWFGLPRPSSNFPQAVWGSCLKCRWLAYASGPWWSYGYFGKSYLASYEHQRGFQDGRKPPHLGQYRAVSFCMILDPCLLQVPRCSQGTWHNGLLPWSPSQKTDRDCNSNIFHFLDCSARSNCDIRNLNELYLRPQVAPALLCPRSREPKRIRKPVDTSSNTN